MMQENSLLKAEDEIKPYLLNLKNCYERAITKYNIIIGCYNDQWLKRTKASIFQNVIINEIKLTFLGKPGIVIIEKYESITLVINNYVSARFKKFNDAGLPSNHRSGRNDAIISQQLTLFTIEYPQSAWVDVGYKLDIGGQKFDTLKVLCRKDKATIWDLYFTDYKDETEPNEESGRVRVINLNLDKNLSTSPRVNINEDNNDNKEAK